MLSHIHMHSITHIVSHITHIVSCIHSITYPTSCIHSTAHTRSHYLVGDDPISDLVKFGKRSSAAVAVSPTEDPGEAEGVRRALG
jgi:hypothetical protein